MIISLLMNPRQKSLKTAVIPMPTKVAVPTREAEKYFSDTGAIYISPTDSAYTEGWLIGDLRDKIPITTTAFSINYDYKIDKFVVVIKDKSKNNQQIFTNWMQEAGYIAIPPQYFVFE